MLTVKTDKKVDFRLRTTTRLLDTATIHEEVFHPVVTSDRMTREKEIETIGILEPAIKTTETFATTTRMLDATTIVSHVDNTMTPTDLLRADPTITTVAAIGAVTETTTAMGTEIGIPTNDLETGVALLTDPDTQIEAGLIVL